MSVSLTLPSLPAAGPFSGVVVDLDGLLVHTERQWLEAKTALFARYDTTLTEADQLAVFGAADGPTAAYFAERLGVPIRQGLMVGDSRNDVGAARNAGCPVVCVPYGHNHGYDIRAAEPDAVIASIAELPALLRQAA